VLDGPWFFPLSRVSGKACLAIPGVQLGNAAPALLCSVSLLPCFAFLVVCQIEFGADSLSGFLAQQVEDRWSLSAFLHRQKFSRNLFFA